MPTAIDPKMAPKAASLLNQYIDGMSPEVVLLSGAIILIVVFSLWQMQNRDGKYRYPPGPRGIPVLGNALQVDQAAPWRTFKRFGAKYGDMFTVIMGQTRWVVLNSHELVKELLDRRGRLYISRPPFPVSQDILSGGNRMLLMQYGERWRNLRRVVHQVLMAKQADEYKPYQDVESRKLLWDYYKSPENFFLHGARFANSGEHSNSPLASDAETVGSLKVIFSVVFGRRTSMQERPVQELFSTIDDFLATQRSPAASLVDGFPVLAKILPRSLQWYRPKADAIFRKTLKVYTMFFDELEERVKHGEDPQCFAREMNKIADRYGFDQAQQYYCAGTILEAGSDTTRNQINLMIAAAAKYPAWVKTAQNEIDSVCGYAERLPSFEDWNALPYIRAVAKESLRWRPNMTTTGVPRVLIEDDSIGPYRFEKGTVFTWNHFCLSHCEETYKQNEVFRPERYLNEDLDDPLKGHWGFGMGRRICSGFHVGYRNMFIAFSRLLYCFDFAEYPDSPIDDCCIDPVAQEVAPFKIKITPRSSKHCELIRAECKSAGTGVE